MRDMKIPKNIRAIMQKLIDSGFEAYIIGGAVRDSILNVEPHDYDIFTNASGKEILKIFPKGKILGGEERQQKILTVIVNGVEVSQYRANGNRTEVGVDLETHLSTCDFTMNAMYCDINGNITDPFDAIYSIFHQETIYAVGEAQDRIDEDKGRIDRAIRQSIQFDLDISDELLDAINNSIDGYKKVPMNRIREEFLKIVLLKGGLRKLSKFEQIFEHIIPEWKDVKNLSGGNHHNETVGEHMLLASEYVQPLTNNPILILSAFLHDIGKGSANQIKEKDGSITFYNHELKSKKITTKIMKRLKFANKDTEYASTMARYHMLQGSLINKRTACKLFGELDSKRISVYDYCLIKYGDHQGNMTNKRCSYNGFIKHIKFVSLYFQYKYQREPFSLKHLAISGKDLIAIGIKPGAHIGTLLNNAFDKVLDGEIDNEKPILMRYIRKQIKVKNDKR